MNDGRNIVDYSGRTVDLLLLKTVTSVPVVGKRVELDVDGAHGEPMIVSGIEKMVQRYALLFLNAMGSTRFRQDHGTDIVPDASKGMIYDEATLSSAAAEANLLALRQMQIADDGADGVTPDDERLTQAEVYAVEFLRARSRIMISVRLTTAAGSSYVYVIPVPIGVH